MEGGKGEGRKTMKEIHTRLKTTRCGEDTVK